ncbi:MAG: glycosyltransferase family 9 protein [Bauldia sp.]|nr:glycosyltransferase family 9 protein [Bauldia sp.]
MTTALVSFKQLGDIILLEPVSRLLAERSGGPVDLFAKREFAPIIGLMAGARAKTWSPRPYRSVLALHEGTKTTRRAAALVSLDKTLIAPGPNEVRWEHRLVYRKVLVRQPGTRYMARHFYEEAGGDPAGFTPPRLARPPAAWRPEGLDLPSRYLVVHPTAAWRSKYWDAGKWARLIEFLESASGLRVVITAGPTRHEREHSEAILAACKGQPLSLAGRTTIANYVWLIANAAGLVAIDGSSCHLADTYRVPAVKLFAQTDERNWHYERPGSWLVLSGPESVYQRPPAKEIPLEAVIAAARSMIEAAGLSA